MKKKEKKKYHLPQKGLQKPAGESLRSKDRNDIPPFLRKDGRITLTATTEKCF